MRWNLTIVFIILISFIFIINCQEDDIAILRKSLREKPNEDPFDLLDQETWSYDLELTLSERILSLMKPLEEVIQVHIILVGFNRLTPVSTIKKF